MAEATVKSKKKKLFEIAKELNVSTDTLKEFLQKKGVDVSKPNMRVSEEIYAMILERFSLEKKAAEKIRKRRQERLQEEQPSRPSREAAATRAVAPEEQPVAQEPTVETAPAEGVARVETPQIEQAPVETPEAAAPSAEAEAEAAAPPEAAEAPAESVEEAEAPPVEAEAEAPEAVEEAEPVVEAEPLEPEAQEEPESEAPAPEPTIEERVAEAIESEVKEEEEEKKATPKVGDVIPDHPGAKRYLEQLRREEELKKERQKRLIQKLKESRDRARKEPKEPKEKPVLPEIEEVAIKPEEELSPEERRRERERKKKKKKTRQELEEEREARRRKALEMIRRDSKRLRPEMISLEGGDEEVEAPPKEKEGRRKRKKKKKQIDEKEIDTSLKKTLAEIRDAGTGRKKRKRVRTQQGTEEEVEENVIQVTEFITTQDLANLLNVSPTELIRKCLDLGLVVTINQRLDMDTIRLLAEEYGYTVEEEKEYASEFLEELEEEPDNPEDLQPRAPVVTVMGHVDHGKTSLLDYIRNTNVVAGEAGGITQHIGAYEVELEDGRKITFLDTPGHEAFTAMRARGAQVTDIVVLVVAADDQVMPQTEEALDHAKAAGVPIIIAINKIDKPGANPDAIRKQLAERNILVEDWGGTYQCVEVSAKTGQNINELLEKILLEAELLELKANPNKRARGVVLEARLDKGKGPVATVLVQEGTLRVGDAFVVGRRAGRVRALLNERGQRIEAAGPSTPVQVLGIDQVPEAGDRFIVMPDEKTAREIAYRREQLKREQDFHQVRHMTLDELSRRIQTGDVKELKLLVKADVDGSAQALADSLQRLSTEKVEVQVIRKAVGPIVESDVNLAAASQAIIIGFHVRPTPKAKELAEREKVDIRLYKVIYDAIEDVQRALEGMLEPVEREVLIGEAEVREIFKISRVGTVAGCYVRSGKIVRNANVRVVRNEVEIYDGKLASLKRFKEDVREVQAGYECGMMLENFNDIREGDIIEAYEVVLEAPTLTRSQ